VNGSTNKFLLYFDISATATPDYEQLCPMNIDYDQGETLDSWNDLCSSLMNNVKTGIDPTWSTSFKFKTTDPVAQFILGKEYAVGEDATCAVKLVNLLKGTTGKQIDFTATLSGISYSAVTEEVLQVDFDIKVCDNSTFVETAYAGSI
jgi:hypothetical protein